MKTISRIFNISIILLGIISVSFSIYQDEVSALFDKLKDKLEEYNAELPHEKLYVHVDKSFYKPGEDIWFKAYLIDGTTHEFSQISEVVYVELINPKGNTEKKLTLPVNKGVTNGYFSIEKTMPGGLYKIRAYTSWMRNFGDDYYFEKEMQVQKVIYPRLLMNLDYEKEAYGAGDQVVATVSLRSLEDKPLKNLKFQYSFALNGVSFVKGSAMSDEKGKAKVIFGLPKDLNTNDGLLNITLSHEGNTESISRSVPIVLNHIDLQFFPEGGDLIKGVKTNVAFKALNEFGKPADIEGKIYDDNHKVVTTFSSYHQGMGSFTLNPVSDKYYAEIIKPAGIEKRYNLPEVIPSGYVLNVLDNEKDFVNLKIVAPKDEILTLVGQIRGKIYYSKSLTMKKGKNIIEVETGKFPIGIIQFTLFDKYEIARCERLVFINSHKKLSIDIKTDKKEYYPRDKVELTVTSYDEDSIPVPANLSLAVVNDKVISFADDKQDNILSYMLVTSELKGKIEEPSFYFDPKEEKAEKALDYLLMTHGWRRFTWEEILNEKYNVKSFPEKITSVSGRVLDKTSYKPVKASITLIEFDETQRAAQLTTSDDGKFIFYNVNPFVKKKLLASSADVKSEQLMIVQDVNFINTNLNVSASDDMLPLIIKNNLKEEPSEKSLSKNEASRSRNFRNSSNKISLPRTVNRTGGTVLEEDNVGLEEIVVIGYGIQKKSDLTGAITSVSRDEIINGINIEQSLQGMASGVVVTQTSSTPGATPFIRIRGTNTTPDDDPYILVDGVPISSNELGNLNPSDINSIEILKDASSAAIYGSSGTNGVILITTKRNTSSNKSLRIKAKNNYAVTNIPQKEFTRVREFYSPQYTSGGETKNRNDFRSTVYWNHEIRTDNKGKATLAFYLSDEVTTFRATVEGIGIKGLIGRNEKTFSSQLPFSLDVKMPSYLMFDDVVKMPVVLKNKTDDKISGNLLISLPENLELLNEIPETITINPNDVKKIFINCKVGRSRSIGELTLSFKSENAEDEITREIEVQPKGFPAEMSFSGQDLKKRYQLTISDPMEGSLNAKFKAFPNIVGELMSGIESIIREPYGCFEQTSSSTYPNIMALQYLSEIDHPDNAIYKKALKYIENGYKRLAAYESPSGGFEWFGSDPGHVALTAYGIMEFVDMQKVYDGVDQKMLDRTVKWIFDKRDGKGNFNAGNVKSHTFGYAGQNVLNAYIIYALSEAGFTELNVEYDKAYEEAIRNKDPYRICLIANASFNMGKKEKAETLLGIMKDKRKVYDWNTMEIEESVVMSYGNSLKIETASLYLLALLSSENKDNDEISKTAMFLKNSRSFGGFGSTQGTILALKSLTEFTRYSKHTQSDGVIKVYSNGNLLGEVKYQKEQRGEIIIDSLAGKLSPGEQNITIEFSETSIPLPYNLDFSWNSLTPVSSNNCEIDLTTNLASDVITMGETVRLSAEITNTRDKEQPMVVALIGIPAGLSAQPWQLKELQKKEKVDYYEVRKNYVIVYYRGMKSGDKKVINLDLKAEIPGEYQAPASTGYLYYTNEYKDWEKGLTISIRE